jgi:hypothetical protein
MVADRKGAILRNYKKKTGKQQLSCMCGTKLLYNVAFESMDGLHELYILLCIFGKESITKAK